MQIALQLEISKTVFFLRSKKKQGIPLPVPGTT